MKNSSLYDQDYLAWIEKTGQQLADAKWDEIDLKNLIEEIQDLGKSQRQALLNNLTIILLHLLKYKYQPAHRRNSWLASIVEHRIRVENQIDDSPSLKPYLQELVNPGSCFLSTSRMMAGYLKTQPYQEQIFHRFGR